MLIQKPEKILNDIRVIRKDLDNCKIKLPPSLVGLYGEFLAYQAIKKHFEPKGYKVIFGAGQSKTDIQLTKGRRTINVEIKTSRLKEEWFGKGYGFAINIKKCKDHPKANFTHPSRGILKGDFCYFDYIVTITLSPDLNKHNFYIFPKSFLEKHERHLRNTNTRFKSATHRIVFAEKPKSTIELTLFDKRLMQNIIKYKNAWEIIK